ncbi:hypothetical protein SUDANB95_05501 [Actinosynnema sp. ALI-1.44]
MKLRTVLLGAATLIPGLRLAVAHSLRLEEAADYAVAVGLTRDEFGEIVDLVLLRHSQGHTNTMEDALLDIRERCVLRANGLKWRP